MNPQHPGSPGGIWSAAGQWLGLNRATLAVLAAIGGLGLSEEIWRNFFGIHILEIVSGGALKTVQPEQVTEAVFYLAVYAVLVNLFEGFGYILGGTIAHRMGARAALMASALPMLAGFGVLLLTTGPWLKILGALLITNWEPLSVPATFDVVGAELPKNRRTIAFAMQSIQKRMPKFIGPLIGALAFASGFWFNLVLALGVLIASVAIQAALLKRMTPKEDPAPVPLKKIFDEMPAGLRQLLSAEILLRWGDWFVRDFANVYVVGVLLQSPKEYGFLLSLTALTALATYIPVAKLADNARTPKPLIGVTFLLFAAFPFCLVLLPKTGLPLSVALAIVFIINGLREIGEPARKSMIASGFPKEVRARAVGLYWGLRSFAFFPAPLIAYVFWKHLGPEQAFLAGGCLGLAGTAWFWLRVHGTPAGER